MVPGRGHQRSAEPVALAAAPSRRAGQGAASSVAKRSRTRHTLGWTTSGGCARRSGSSGELPRREQEIVALCELAELTYAEAAVALRVARRHRPLAAARGSGRRLRGPRGGRNSERGTGDVPATGRWSGRCSHSRWRTARLPRATLGSRGVFASGSEHLCADCAEAPDLAPPAGGLAAAAAAATIVLRRRGWQRRRDGFRRRGAPRSRPQSRASGCYETDSLEVGVAVVDADGRDPAGDLRGARRTGDLRGPIPDLPEPREREIGPVGVFREPSPGTCKRLGLAELPASYAAKGKRFAELREAIFDRIGWPGSGSDPGSGRCTGEAGDPRGRAGGAPRPWIHAGWGHRGR